MLGFSFNYLAGFYQDDINAIVEAWGVIQYCNCSIHLILSTSRNYYYDIMNGNQRNARFVWVEWENNLTKKSVFFKEFGHAVLNI